MVQTSDGDKFVKSSLHRYLFIVSDDRYKRTSLIKLLVTKKRKRSELLNIINDVTVTIFGGRKKQ
jgi:hypothetical protein